MFDALASAAANVNGSIVGFLVFRLIIIIYCIRIFM